MDKDDENFLDDLLKSLGHLNDEQKAKVIRSYIDLLNRKPDEDEIERFLSGRKLPTK
jgi:hypothetical protein